MDKFWLCTLGGAFGAAICQFLGGWDTPLEALLVFMIIDFVLGLVVAIVFKKSDKSESGGLSSKACWKGIFKKVTTLLIVAVANYSDKLLSSDYICNSVKIAFCLSELISIVELAAQMEVLPQGVQQVLNRVIDVMKLKGDNNNGSN